MNFINRNTTPGNWNFQQSDIEEGKALLENEDIKAAAKDIAKYTIRSMELLGDNPNQINISWNIQKTGAVIVWYRGLSTTFRCKSVTVSGEKDQRAAMWALQKLAIPEILNKTTGFENYCIQISDRYVFEGVTAYFDYK